MSNKKITHYSLDKIKKTGALFYLIYGKKNNGKSYAIKHQVINEYLETGKRFIYFRRYKPEIRQDAVEQYFHDVDVRKLTNNRYNCIVAYRSKIYFANFNEETFKTVKGEQIGYYNCLTKEQDASGGSFLDVGSIIFEEFMSRTTYTSTETEKLLFFYDTIDRKKYDTKLYLVGNTITRACPYLIDWGLMDIIKTIQKGQIMTTEIESTDENEDRTYTMAIEWCSGKDGGAGIKLGSAANSIAEGDWLSEPQPTLLKYKNNKVLYRFVFERKTFRYLCEFRQVETEDEKVLYWFVRPKYTEVKPKTIVVSDTMQLKNWYFSSFKDLSNKIKNRNTCGSLPNHYSLWEKTAFTFLCRTCYN